MAHLIDKDALVAEIDKGINGRNDWQLDEYRKGYHDALIMLKKYLYTLKVKEIDLEKESEFIANCIMIGVQANKYNTCIYNTTRCDFNHSHLMFAARKGIELGLKSKGEKL